MNTTTLQQNSSTTTRRPQKRRQRSRARGIEIQPRDLELLAVLAQNRVAKADQLFRIVRTGDPRYMAGDPKKASSAYKKFSARLRTLFDHAYVDRLDVPGAWFSGGGRDTWVYALQDRGAAELLASGYKNLTATAPQSWRKKNTKAQQSAQNGHYYIQHELDGTELLATCKHALPPRSFFWFSEHEWKDHTKHAKVPVTWSGQTTEQGIYPDRGLAIQYDHDGRHYQRWFLIEIDRATEPGIRTNIRGGTSLFRKYLAYDQWWRSGAYKRFNLPGFRVLTITTSPERAENLRAAAKKLDPRGGSHMFWFTTFDQYQDQPNNILNPIFSSAGDPLGSRERHALLEFEAA